MIFSQYRLPDFLFFFVCSEYIDFTGTPELLIFLSINLADKFSKSGNKIQKQSF